MGSGALCLTRYYPGLSSDFRADENVVVWYELEDLIDKIYYYLENYEEGQDIAERGCKLVHEKYTWDERMKEVLNMYQIYQAEKMGY